jgi:hypothetical protein
MTKEEQIAITKYDLYYESRMTKVEYAIEHLMNDTKEIKADLRWILGIIFAFGSIIMGLMAHGFKWF